MEKSISLIAGPLMHSMSVESKAAVVCEYRAPTGRSSESGRIVNERNSH